MVEEFTITGWSKLGGVVRDARRAKGLTQSDAATRAGVARSWLARVEAGHRSAELDPLLRLVAALGLELTLKQSGATDETEVKADSADAPSPADDLRAIAAARRDAWQQSATRGQR